MDDPVLHRKLFREKALRVGVLRPKRYQVGTGPMGVAPITPEGPTYNPYTTKTVDGKVYSLDRMGNVVKVDYLPANIPEGPKPMSRILQGLEAIVDPPSAYERGTYRKIGQAVFNPETYKSIGATGVKAVKGIGSILKQAPGYLAVEEAANVAGVPGEVAFPTLFASGLADTATARGAFQGAGIKNLLGRGAVRALASPAVLAGAVNPYVLGAGAIASPVIAAKMLHDYRMANNPEYAALIEKEKELQKNEPTLDPDTSMMMYGTPQKLNLKDVTPQGGGTGAGGTPPGGTPPAGSDFSNMGGVSQPLVTPAGTVKPLGDFQPKEDTFTTNIEKGSKNLNNSPTVTPKKGEAKELGVFDRLGNFARTASGNAFLLKLAAGLLSGKGSFGEVVGNALNPAVDLFAAYRLKEQEMDKKLMEAQLKALTDAKKDVKLADGSFPIQLKDGITTYVPARLDEKTREGIYYLNGKEYAIPTEQTNRFRARPLETDAQTIKIYGKVGDNIGAQAIITDLLSQDPNTLGTGGAVKYLFYRSTGVAKALATSASPASTSFDDIVDSSGKTVTGDEAKKAKDLNKKIDENIKYMDKNYFKSLDNNTQAVLAKNGVNAQTLKYFLANTFKDEDRLTNRDLEYIEKITNILAYSKGGKQVQDELRVVEGYLRNKQTTYLRQLNEKGLDDSTIATAMFSRPGGQLGLGYMLESPTFLGKDKQPLDLKSKSIQDINILLQNTGIK